MAGDMIQVVKGGDVRTISRSQLPGFTAAGFTVAAASSPTTSPYWQGGTAGTGPTDAQVAAANAAAPTAVSPFTPASPDIVGDTYFDVLLKQTEAQSGTARQQAQGNYDTFIKQLKEGRALFDENNAKTYAQSLQKINENAYARGVGQSGIRQGNFTEAKTTNDFNVKQQDIADQQKQEIANADLNNRLQSITSSEANTRAALKSPYATYQY